jgi:hypothetical protein
MAKIGPKPAKAGFAVLTRSLRLFHGAGMNGHLAICSICREIMS